MTAVAALGRAEAGTGVALPSGTLAHLLDEAAGRDAAALAFRDQPGRAAWCGRPTGETDRARAGFAIRRLTGFLANLPLESGAAVGICLPNGTEACLAILAVQAAGLTPCLLDVSASASELSAAIQAADIRAAITQGVLGPDRPAATLCFVAAGFLRLRFLMGFGPGLPRGVTDLDAVIADDGRAGPDRPFPYTTLPGLVTFAFDEGRPVPVRHTALSLLSASAGILAATRLQPGERVLTLMAADDLAGTVTGLVPALVSGAVLEPHGVFEAGALIAALNHPEPVHLVAPGWLAPALGAAGLGDRLRSVVLVHHAPVRLEPVPGLRGHVVDAVALGEVAVATASRQGGRPGLALHRIGAGGYLEMDRDADGAIRVRGPGVSGEGDAWISTGFAAPPGTDPVTEISRHGREPSQKT